MKKEYVNKIFENIADKYDLMNDMMSFGLHKKWKNQFINHIDLNKSKNNILDIGAGTGDIVSLIDKKYKSKINYTAYLVDPNTEMMNQGKIKVRNKNINWLASYGEMLPFKKNMFDLVTMSFSLRNVENLGKTLKEINRVLKKNGQFLCLEFGKVDNLLINTMYKFYSDNFIPKIGKRITGNEKAYQYLVESIKRFPSQKNLVKILKKKNFNEISYHNLDFGIAVVYSCKKK